MTNRPNGCGPRGLVGKIIPDKLLGVSIHEACNIHDQRYLRGGVAWKRVKADREFLDNMLKEIEKKSKSKILKGMRKISAYLYYLGVRWFGEFFFEK